MTGASTGIGRSAAVALARAGYNVAINFSGNAAGAEETAALVRSAGTDALTIKADVARLADVEALASEVEGRFGHLDVLINNAGTTIATPPKAMAEVSEADWDRVFAVNVKGMFFVTRACVPLLEKSDAPSIVNTCSIVGIRPGPQPLPYAASKAAAVNLTKTMAGALGPKIRVNGVAPGWMEGEWMERALGDNYDRLMERRAKLTPLKRCVTSEDVAETMLALIQHQRFVSGEVVVVDGGFTATT